MIRHHRRAAAVLLAVCVTTVACDGLRIRMSLKDGNELYRAEKYEDAIRQYEQILKLDPDHWEANYLVGISYMALYHPGSAHAKDIEYSDKAIAALEKSLSLPAPNPEERQKVQKFYMHMLTSRDKVDKAIAYLEQELAQEPQNVSLMMQLAALSTKQGNFAKALEYYQKRADAQPQEKEAWYSIGAACWDRSYNGTALMSPEEQDKIVDRGIQALEKALAIDPSYFDALSYINLLYREKSKVMVALGKYVEAQEAYRTADDYQKKAIEASKQQSTTVGA